MASLDFFKVDGFEDLNKKIKLLPDRVKRTELLKIQRQLAKPIQKAYERNLPVNIGTLSRSVAIKTVSVRRSGGNPVINVVPGKRGRNDAYYRFMVIPKGSRPGSRQRGSRKGLNSVVPEARDRTLSQVESGVVKQSEEKVSAYVQKQIEKLSR
ncbi:HK97 gp10 family phage protein [Flagellimonas sp. S174]|uniref:HK97 gp10 family phage protein n=1 Tax=Flagellimonas sp. S174 TaxID=3410790 RepID=UPI003BF4B0EB